ncbi:hypothetical protein [Nocardioides panaciterrulae]|uniref:Uncharacterized protein n=1 Tax=Nocardioides panaciterrulae TaxID=661492 RepID=A0A7Y9E517_9ACTN|nr:hypothetical protein [Nocardioides panaciterrulae]NYD41388.1 hypothetical protein [Nocardioides panaciterrulae]
MLVRTIFGSLATSALIAGGLAAPASAHGDHRHHHHHADEVKVLVCAKFQDHHDHGDHHGDDRGTDPGSDHGDDHHGDDAQVAITVRTDEDQGSATLGDGECSRFQLDFHRSLLRVYAATQDDEGHIRFKVFGDVVGAWSRDNLLKVRFDAGEDHPFVGVGVGVEEDHHHHDH